MTAPPVSRRNAVSPVPQVDWRHLAPLLGGLVGPLAIILIRAQSRERELLEQWRLARELVELQGSSVTLPSDALAIITAGQGQVCALEPDHAAGSRALDAERTAAAGVQVTDCPCCKAFLDKFDGAAA